MLDTAPVVCEPFRQWVIAGDFAAGRPAWERSGAQFVTDVAPFEAMKLRLLNASHSMLAYLGFLAGYETIWQVAAHPDFAAVMRGLMEEATPTLALPADVDLPAYKAALVERFGNPALPHRTQQIAMDGSQKLPQRLLGTVRDNLAAGRPIDRAALAVAGWMRYVSGVDEAGRAIRISDPLAADFARVAAATAAIRARSPAACSASPPSSAPICRPIRALSARLRAGSRRCSPTVRRAPWRGRRRAAHRSPTKEPR